MEINERKNILAWTNDPAPKGKLYYEGDLFVFETVIDIFSFCKVSAGYINADGWEFLFKTYGGQDLLSLKVQSGWVDSNMTTTISDLVYQSFMAGYNPIHHEKGDYDETIEIFLSLDGAKRVVDWGEIDSLNHL